MRIGIVALLHESNTFSAKPTTIEDFRQNLLLTGEPIREALADSHHEIGGFFGGLDAAGAVAVPLFAARALPSGVIDARDFETLIDTLLDAVRSQLPLDGILVAPHGATVSEKHRDADGHWLHALRRLVGPTLPIIGTLDAHANLSPQMVKQCDALIAYRTNPHLDQRARGIDAAEMIVRTVRGEIHPVMSAAYPPLAISIEKQETEQPPLRGLYVAANEQLSVEGVLSNSLLLGFPYADVSEMGAAAVVVADGNKALADRLVGDLASSIWLSRHQMQSEFVSVEQALDQCERSSERICLLDMGDNVGGGSSADGTELLSAIDRRKVGPALGCLFDPQSVAACEQADVGARIELRVGGKTDDLHGAPFSLECNFISLHEGKFREPEPRHGGITDFDQGRTAVVKSADGLTLILTSRRMVPFSLQQIYSCALDPKDYRILVAKGVNAPIAAYRQVCDRFIRVNTCGSTCADLSRMSYQHRRRSMFPLESDAKFAVE